MKKLGKTGPDKAPDDGEYEWKGEKIPNGVDPGWNYAPGESQSDRLRGAFSKKAWPEGIKKKFEESMDQSKGKSDIGIARAVAAVDLSAPKAPANTP